MQLFTTEGLPAAQRADRYEEALRGFVFDNAATGSIEVGPAAGSIEASISGVRLGDVEGALHKSNAPHALHMIPTDPTPDCVDFYVLLSGEIAFDCAGQSTIQLGPGQMVLMPRNMELRSSSSTMELIALSLPEQLVHGHLGRGWASHLDPIYDMPLVGACLGAMLTTAAHADLSLSARETDLLRGSIVCTVFDVLRSVTRRQAGRERVRKSDLERIQHRVAELLGDPQLCPALLAAELGISVRTLHRAYHSAGSTFQRSVRDLRLERCWAELADPAPSRCSIAAIAFRWGFNDLTTFNRSFRERYGAAPTDVRVMLRRPTARFTS